MHKESEERLRRLQTTNDELDKFEEEMSKMESWLGGAEDGLRACQRAGGDLDNLGAQQDKQKAFKEDVVAHQADLRFLNMQAQRFIDEVKVKLCFNSISVSYLIVPLKRRGTLE